MAGPKIGPTVDAQVDPASVSVAIGGYVCGTAAVAFDEDRPVTKLSVTNTGDRPIQVGSHFHFFEANSALEFDRGQAFGKRLDIPATTALRFEPGDEKEISLVPYQGKQRVFGFNGLVNGWAGDESYDDYRPRLADALERVARYGYKNKP